MPEVLEDAPPPPPVFSLEELGMARDESFSQGRLTGLEEAAASREQYIATQIETLAHDLKGILLAERMRERTFEKEVIGLCEAIFAKVFPELNRRHGLGEVTQIIRAAILAQDQSKLTIDVPEGETAEIEAHLAKASGYDPERITLRESSDLERGSCRISWQNGGALRDHARIAAQIAAELAATAQQGLAPRAQKDHTDEIPHPSKGDE